MENEFAVVGFVETVELGRDFAVVSGWAATSDQQKLEEQILLRLEGAGEIALENFAYREDLEKAGIANGYGAFSVTFYFNGILEGRPQVFAVGGTNEMVPFSGPGTIYSPFVPKGALDTIDADSVSGWLFDPGLRYSDDKPFLIVGEADKINLELDIDRVDLIYDKARGQQKFGFQITKAKLEGIGADKKKKTSSVRLISSTEIVCTYQYSDLGWIRAKNNKLSLTPDAEKSKEKRNISLSKDGISGKEILLRIEEVSALGAGILVRGWVCQSDKSAISDTLIFKIDNAKPVVVTELDYRQDLERNGVGAGKAGFTILFYEVNFSEALNVLCEVGEKSKVLAPLKSGKLTTKVSGPELIFVGSSELKIDYLDWKEGSEEHLDIYVDDYFCAKVKPEEPSG